MTEAFFCFGVIIYFVIFEYDVDLKKKGLASVSSESSAEMVPSCSSFFLSCSTGTDCVVYGGEPIF